MIAYFKQEIPFFRYLWFFIIGISISIGFNLKPSSLFIATWLFVFLTLIFCFKITKKIKFQYYNWLNGILISLLFLLAGIINTNNSKEFYDKKHFSKTKSDYLIVTIAEKPIIKGDIIRFKSTVNQYIKNKTTENTTGNLMLALKIDTNNISNYNYGDKLLLKSKYEEVKPPLNPAEFNYKRYLSYQQIFHQTFVNSNEVFLIAKEKGNYLISFLLKLRSKQVEKFNKYLTDKDAKSVAATLILGDRADLSHEILEAYSKTGTIHILSVSGMHVAIVVILLDKVFTPLKRYKKGKVVKLFLMLILIWFYSFLTGLAPSILRAALMLSLYIVGKHISRKTNIYNIIGLSAFVILLHNPFNLMDVGFQLSFLAVFGLVYIFPKISSIAIFKNKFGNLVWKTACISLAAQITTSIISIYYFHQFPTYFLISNLIIAAPATVIMYLGIFMLLFSFIEPIMPLVGFILNYTITFTNNVIVFIENLPFAVIPKIWFSITEIILLNLFLILILSESKTKFKIKWASFIIICFISIKSYNLMQHLNQEKILFYSLRKNTAVAFIKSNHAILITDLEPTDKNFKFSIQPYLDSCQIFNYKILKPLNNNGLYLFNNTKIQIVNTPVNLQENTKPNWILFTNDKKYDINKLIQNNLNANYIISAKTKKYITEEYLQQLKAFHTNYYSLKDNKALEIDLKRQK